MNICFADIYFRRVLNVIAMLSRSPRPIKNQDRRKISSQYQDNSPNFVKLYNSRYSNKKIKGDASVRPAGKHAACFGEEVPTMSQTYCVNTNDILGQGILHQLP